MDSPGTQQYSDPGADTWIERLLDAISAGPPDDGEWEAIAFDTCSAARCERERELALARLAEWTV